MCGSVSETSLGLIVSSTALQISRQEGLSNACLRREDKLPSSYERVTSLYSPLPSAVERENVTSSDDLGTNGRFVGLDGGVTLRSKKET